MPHSHGHGHSHGHAHSHGGGKKDFWTKWNQVGEYVDALGTAYFFQGTVDNIKDLIEYAMGNYDPENESNVYKYTLTGVSFATAMVLAYGAAYCHGILNQQYQDPEQPVGDEQHAHAASQDHRYHPLNGETKEEAAAALEEEHQTHAVPRGHDYHSLNGEAKEEAADAAHRAHTISPAHDYHPLNGDAIEEATDVALEEGGLNAQPDVEPSNPPVLSGTQKMLLTADGICHGAGKAGTFMGLANSFLFFAAPGLSNSPGMRLGLQAVGTFFGVGAAVAEVRTCRKSLLNHNMAEQCVEAPRREHRH